MAWLAATLASCLVALATMVEPAEAAFPGANGRIVFAKENTQDCAYGSCSYEIYTINSDGSGQKRLTNNGWADTYPAWSPDGRKIAWLAYRGSYDLFKMTANGNNKTRVTSDSAKERYPAWSPDGRKIAFERNDDIYIINASGTGQATQLTNDPARDTYPDWSPDGAKIAFTRATGGGGAEIYAISATTPESNANQPEQLTDDVGKENGYPSWSPNGLRIAFHSNRDGDYDIYKMDADGTDETRLTSSPATDFDPAYSPTNRKIAFVSSRKGNYEIYKMDFDGTDEIRITSNTVTDLLPDWQPLP